MEKVVEFTGFSFVVLRVSYSHFRVTLENPL